MHPPERRNAPVAEIEAVVMVDKVASQVVDNHADDKTDTRSTSAHSAKWITILPKHGEGESALKMTQTTAIQ